MLPLVQAQEIQEEKRLRNNARKKKKSTETEFRSYIGLTNLQSSFSILLVAVVSNLG